ncbi:hypothetical protein HN51_065125 [Arachis hypogaea]
MGNCMACHSQPKKQTRGPLVEERRREVDASAPVEKMSPADSKHYITVCSKLQDGEIYHLVRTNDNRKLRTSSVKIVVTTKQLALLLGGPKKLKIRSGVDRVRESPVYRGCRKWLPSLPTIPEVQNY